MSRSRAFIRVKKVRSANREAVLAASVLQRAVMSQVQVANSFSS